MKLPCLKLSDHGSEIGLLGFISAVVALVMAIGLWRSTTFDPSAYLVVLTLIVGAVKERWTQRSLDRMGQSLANAPPSDPPAQGPK
ncbi:hypothetical protein [Sphingobium sp. YR768]|uniref:hypothetical protein n=1 Tax=Sphingobium sp. YR768 TaxID=1884365 RepID=UPI0008B88C9A|nr:hypothetical protein [Sphingobium sp. YR768]SES03508.1 hypothetical protein SAMN05518866_1334 [Sphingobium sp. YR768]